MQEGKVGEACARYENAITFDRTFKVGFLKLARVYKTINTNEALKYLDELVALDPNYIPAYAEIGDLYDISSIDESNVNYKKALDAYEKFISIPGVPLLQHERYARLLYFTGQYDRSLQEIDHLLTLAPNNPVLYRLQAYDNSKLENYALAAQQLTAFLDNNPEKDHIYLDYITLGRALLKEKQIEQAIAILTKATQAKDAKTEAYKELATAYELENNYKEAINVYEKYFELEASPVAFDFFYYGQDNYYAAAKYISADHLAVKRTPEEQAIDDADLQSYVNKGSKAFTEVISQRPESYLGYLWKARIVSFLDVVAQSRSEKMEGLAKPFFEEALQVMASKNEDGARNKDIIESCLYLGSYHYLLKDKEKAGEYYLKILEIDPNHAGAKTVLDDLKIKY